MKRTTILGLVAFTGIACLSQSAPRSRAKPDCLLVAPFATAVKHAVSYGRDQLTYTVEQPYPATDALAFISDGLKKKHWKPLKDDFWNPGLPSSHVTGWGAFDDATSSPKERVYQWMAQWENDRHDVVSYVLQYRYPTTDAKNEPQHNMSTLHVIAIYIPAKIAVRTKDEQKVSSPK